MVGRVVVGVSGSLGNLSALHAAVSLARRSCTPIVAVHAWAPAGGEHSYRRAPCAPLLALGREEAEARLEQAFADAFGGRPQDVGLTSVVARGEPGRTLVALARGPADVLVLGSGRRRRLHPLHTGPVNRFCVRYSPCPVVTVPPPPMIADLHRLPRRHPAVG